MQRHHVVMIVANDVSSDTRVRKMAADMAASGHRVTVLGMSLSGKREEFSLGKAAVITLPISSYRGSVPRGLLSFFRRETSPHLLSRRIAGARDAFFLHQREVGAEIGWMRQDFLSTRANKYEDLNSADRERRKALKRRRVALETIKQRVAEWNGPIDFIATGGLTVLIKLDRAFTIAFSKLVKFRVIGAQRVQQELVRRRELRMRSRLKRRERRYNEVTSRWTDRMVAQVSAPENKPGSVHWRREIPELYDYDQTFSPEIELQNPDVLHVHDVHLLGVGARAVARRYVGGVDTKLIYDAHEYVGGLSRYPKRTLYAWVDLEREYFLRADRVITVSEPLAKLLESDYKMSTPPTVVMNIPASGAGGSESIRTASGLDESAPLLVYSGGLDRTRGIHTLVKALAWLPEVHLALVAKTSSGYVKELEQIAADGGYRDRIHVVPFVEPNHVVSYLSSADAAVHPMVSGFMNHEIALPNKIFEYMHAGLPMIVSDCRAMSELVTQLGIGESFESENAESLAETAEKVLSEIEKYRRVYRERPELLEIYSWKGQFNKLMTLYEALFHELDVADTGDDGTTQPTDLANS